MEIALQHETDKETRTSETLHTHFLAEKTETGRLTKKMGDQ
jgi:hypothetical protein